MRILNRLSVLLLAAGLFSACSQETTTPDPSNEVMTFLPFTTRSAMESGFAENDQIGVYLYDSSLTNFNKGSNAWVSNLTLTCGATLDWTPGEQLYWQEVPYTLHCIAYYPYRTLGTSDDLTQLSLQLSTDQTTVTALRENDFLWTRVENISYATYGSGIPLKMEHLLSKITVTFTGFPDAISDVRLTNAYCSALLNLTTGEITLRSSSIPVIKMYYDEVAQKAEAILLPQTVAAGTFITFISKGTTYVYTLDAPLELKKGDDYAISLDGSTL